MRLCAVVGLWFCFFDIMHTLLCQPRTTHGAGQGFRGVAVVLVVLLWYSCVVKQEIQGRVLQYTAVFEPAEEGGFVVSIPALPGCLSEGDTFEEARSNIEEAARLYLEVLREDKEFIPEEHGTVVAPVSVPT
jgi:antitoxin HicB